MFWEKDAFMHPLANHVTLVTDDGASAKIVGAILRFGNLNLWTNKLPEDAENGICRV